MYQYGKTVMSPLKQGRKTSWTQRTSREEHFLFILDVSSSVFTQSAGEGHCSANYVFLFAKDRSRRDWLYTRLDGSTKRRKKEKRKSKEKKIYSRLSRVPLQCFHHWGCTDREGGSQLNECLPHRMRHPILQNCWSLWMAAHLICMLTTLSSSPGAFPCCTQFTGQIQLHFFLFPSRFWCHWLAPPSPLPWCFRKAGIMWVVFRKWWDHTGH